MKELEELADLKILLSNEADKKRRRELMIKISSCEDAIATLVRNPGNHDEYYRKFQSRELVRRFERDVNIRNTISRKIRAHEDAITPSVKRVACAPKIAVRYGFVRRGRSIFTGRSRFLGLIWRYNRRFPKTKTSDLVRKLLKRNRLGRDTDGRPFQISERTARRFVDQVRKPSNHNIMK